MENVSYEEFEKKCERANASRFWEYREGTVVIIELPNRDHEIAHGEFTRGFILQDPQSTIDGVGSASIYFTYSLRIYIIYLDLTLAFSLFCYSGT